MSDYSTSLKEMPSVHLTAGDPTARRAKKASRAAALPSPRQLDAALQGAKICLFSQDRELRYLWMSGPLCGIDPLEILDRTDDTLGDLFDQAEAIVAKRRVIETGERAVSEFSCNASGREAAFSIHIEPTLSPDGDIEGVICTAFEITDRKEREAHLKMLLREITHRSKNLLAVIQGMARQTARHAGSIDNFLSLFSGRVQSLAQSHDLLVQQNWHDASLEDVVRRQLALYLEREETPITLGGPHVSLSPEATQSIGLALHELASNAVKHGSLTLPSGKVSVTWRQEAGNRIEILWSESGGPEVPETRNPGFGSVVLKNTLPRALGAEVDLDFRPGGLQCRMSFPATQN